MNTHNYPRLSVLFPALLTLSASLASAQSQWSATPVDGEWTNPANWVGGIVPNGNTETVVFGASSVTEIGLNTPQTIKTLTFASNAPAYTFAGEELVIDSNASAAIDALVLSEGANLVTFLNALELRNSTAQSSANDWPAQVRVASGTSFVFEGPVTTADGQHFHVGGEGQIFVKNSLQTSGHIKQTGSAVLNLMHPSISASYIRSFSNEGQINFHANTSRRLGAGVWAGASHNGRVFLAAPGIVSSGDFIYIGSDNSGSGQTADMLFGCDIPGSGSATHQGKIIFESLPGTGTTAFYRFHTGEHDIFHIVGAIEGNPSGYTNPVFHKQGSGTAILSGVSTYTIPTEVAEGALVVIGSLATTPITVREGALLGGSGTVAGSVTVENGATLRLGEGTGSPNDFTVGSVSLHGKLLFRYANGFPALEVGETLRLLEGASLDLETGEAELTDLSYPLASWATLEGTFASVSGLPSGYILDYAFGGNQIALVRQTSDAYTIWIDTFPELTGTDRNKAADPDGDGLTNFEEYAFGGHPAQVTPPAVFVGRHGTVSGNHVFAGVARLPEAVAFQIEDGRLAATVGALKYLVEGSRDLVSWGTVLPTEITEPAEAGTFQDDLADLPEGWTYRVFRTAAAIDAPWFLRVRVVE